MQTAQGKLYLFVAIDRTSKFAVAQLVHKANTQTARAFVEALVAAVPYRVEIVLTDNGIQFADSPTDQAQRPNIADILSVASVGNTGSNIG